MKRKIKHKKLLITLGIIFSVFLIIFATFGIYVSIYYHAKDYAKSCLVSSDIVEVKRENNKITFIPNEQEIKTGLIFYPGGKVEYTSYTPLMMEFAKKGILSILIKMPFNLAVFDVNAADGIISSYENISSWYIGGHSLGGSMAASYVSKHLGDFDGLLLLGSYSTSNLKDSNLNVISIYGSNDQVLNHQKYDKYKGNLPDSTLEYIIDGGCHSYFGDYGHQKGDGKPTITLQEQVEITATIFSENI